MQACQCALMVICDWVESFILPALLRQMSEQCCHFSSRSTEAENKIVDTDPDGLQLGRAPREDGEAWQLVFVMDGSDEIRSAL